MFSPVFASGAGRPSPPVATCRIARGSGGRRSVASALGSFFREGSIRSPARAPAPRPPGPALGGGTCPCPPSSDSCWTAPSRPSRARGVSRRTSASRGRNARGASTKMLFLRGECKFSPSSSQTPLASYRPRTTASRPRNRPSPRKWRGRPARNRPSSLLYAVFDRPVPARLTTHPRDTPALDPAPRPPTNMADDEEKKWYKDKTRLVSGFVGATVRRARARPFARRLVSDVVVSASFSVAKTPSRTRLVPLAARRPSRPRASLARETRRPDSRRSPPAPSRRSPPPPSAPPTSSRRRRTTRTRSEPRDGSPRTIHDPTSDASRRSPPGRAPVAPATPPPATRAIRHPLARC